jgi:uncharacterized protein (TIGR00290 family)
MSKPRLLLSWSSGKDSAWTLYRLQCEGGYEIAGLVTTVNDAFNRVAMHAVRVELLEAQAQAAGLPLWRVPLPYPCPNAEYERAMGTLIEGARADGVTHMAFGDLFLEDVRRYRENQLANTGITPVFPLWGMNTAALAREMFRGGLEAIITCIDPHQLSPEFVGRGFNEKLLAELPAEADPCGENGEFHTFCHAGPMFRSPIAIRAGEIVERDGFVYADVLPANSSDRVVLDRRTH